MHIQLDENGVPIDGDGYSTAGLPRPHYHLHYHAPPAPPVVQEPAYVYDPNPVVDAAARLVNAVTGAVFSVAFWALVLVSILLATGGDEYTAEHLTFAAVLLVIRFSGRHLIRKFRRR